MDVSRFEDGEQFFWFAKENRVNCPEIGYLARKIAKQYETNTGKKSKYIEHIVCNCYMAWMYKQAVAFFSKNDYWTAYNAQIKDRKDKFSVISFRSEINSMKLYGYIDTLKGKKCDWNAKLSMASRMVPTSMLEEQFDIAWESAIEYTSDTIRYKKHKNDTPIQLKDLKDHADVVAPTQEVIDRKDFLEVYNSYLRKNHYTYEGIIRNYLWDSENKYTVVTEKQGEVRFIPQLTSNYSGSWVRGGRFYAHGVFGMVDYQQLSKDERETIKINGEKTTEVDYACLHLSLMYAKRGLQLNKDAYAWYHDRKIAKLVTIISLNTTCYYNAVGAVQKALEGKDEAWLASKLITAMLKYHKKIHDLFFSRILKVDALTLQYEDSCIMYGVLKALHKRNIPALPVHDSVIVPESRKAVAIRIMKEQYKKATNFEIEVK
jgi:hypothetical protein